MEETPPQENLESLRESEIAPETVSEKISEEQDFDYEKEIEHLDQQIIQVTTSAEQIKNKVNEIRNELGLESDENLEIPSVQRAEEHISKLTVQKTRFNLDKPEGWGGNKIKNITLHDLPVPPEATLADLQRTGEKVIDIKGRERVITGTNYNLSESTNMHIRGQSYSYRNKSNPDNYISADFDKKKGELSKMHFKSENPFFSGKAMVDLVERIPPGTEILGKETSMSTDSFPLLLNSLDKYLSKTPDRFTVSQIGELNLNDQGMYSAISQAETDEEKIILINKLIDDFSQKTKIELSHARKEVSDDETSILIPKIKIVKNY